MADIIHLEQGGARCAKCGIPMTSATAEDREDGLYCDACLTALVDEGQPQVERLREVLQEARLQIEYLHDKFQPTSTGVAVLARIDAALNIHKGQEP